jgi:hypothetical protein
MIPEAAIAVEGIRDILDHNPVVGEPRRGPRRFWTGREEMVLRAYYPDGGVPACLSMLPGRTASAIYNRANQLGIKSAAFAKQGYHRERWTSSEQIDAVIRRVYPTCTAKNDVNRLAVSLSRPPWWVSKRAARLGLVSPRFKALPWSQPELDYIQERAHINPNNLRMGLARLGYRRTETAISVMLRRLGACTHDPNEYNANGLAALFGIDRKGVLNWIEKGWLKAKRRGELWSIRRRDVRAFVADNMHAVDIRKVDKFWFIDLLLHRDL